MGRAESRAANSIPRRPLGTAAVPRLPESEGDERASRTADAPRPGHDFSRIPIHAKRDAVVQAKSAAGVGNRRIMDRALLHCVLSAPGQPLDAATRGFMEPRLRQDLGSVRVHTGDRAAESARAVHARAYAVGRHVVFGDGEYAPGTDEGKRLIAHELVHTVQQGGGGERPQFRSRAVVDAADASEREADRIAGAVMAGSLAGPVTPRAPAVARAPEDKAPAPPVSASPPYMGYAPDLGDVAAQTVEPMDTVGVVDVPVASLYARLPPHAPVATVTSGTTLVVKGFIQPSDRSKPGVYVAHYHGRMANMQSEQVEVLVELFSLSVSSVGPAKDQPSAVQTANDWMAVVPDWGKKGDPEAMKPVLASIRDARAGIENRRLSFITKNGEKRPRDGYMSEADEKTPQYDRWLRHKDTHPRLATGPDDLRWKVLRRFFGAEGRPSAMMTYDSTNITWGPGFAGMGVSGITEQAMARLFNQSQEAKDAFWRVGITVVGVDLVMVNIKDAGKGIGEKLHGTAAENVLRLDKKLVSFFVNVSEGLTRPGQTDPSASLRQKVLDAHFETFLNTTLRGSAGIIDGMDEKAAALAAHAVHTNNHSWGQFRGATSESEVEQRIKNRIADLERRKAAREKVPYIYAFDHIAANLGSTWVDP
jgi:hypothetical protein